MKNDRFKGNIETIRTMEPNARLDVLSTTNAISLLVNSGHGDEILRLIDNVSADQKFRILNAEGALEALLRKTPIQPIVNAIENFGHEQQAILLSKPYIIPRCLCSTFESAVQTLQIIAKLPREQQTQILSKSDVVSSLSKQGLAVDVFNIIKKLTTFQKDRVRVAKGYAEVVSYCSRRSSTRQLQHLPLTTNAI